MVAEYQAIFAQLNLYILLYVT